MIFIKRKTLVLDFFTYFKFAYDYSPIEYNNQKFIVSLWSELKIDTEQFSYKYWFPNGDERIEEYRDDEIHNKNYLFLKMYSPWMIRSNYKCHISWVGAINHEFNLIVKPVIQKINKITGINTKLILPNTIEPKKYFFNFNQPLMYGIPLTENKIKIKTHLVSNDEFMQMDASANRRESMEKYRKENML